MSDYSITQAKNGLPQLVRDAEAGREVRLTRRGRPVAVLVSAETYDELKAVRPDFMDRYRKFRAEVDLAALSLDPDEIFAETRERSPGRDFAW
jgi:prevent-host-death family protein